MVFRVEIPPVGGGGGGERIRRDTYKQNHPIAVAQVCHLVDVVAFEVLPRVQQLLRIDLTVNNFLMHQPPRLELIRPDLIGL